MAHSLAGSLGVTLEFVPLKGGQSGRETYAEDLGSGYCDIVMSGSAITVTREAGPVFVFSEPYLQMNVGYMVPDYRRSEFVDAGVLSERSDLRIAVPNLPYYIDRVHLIAISTPNTTSETRSNGSSTVARLVSPSFDMAPPRLVGQTDQPLGRNGRNAVLSHWTFESASTLWPTSPGQPSPPGRSRALPTLAAPHLAAPPS